MTYLKTDKGFPNESWLMLANCRRCSDEMALTLANFLKANILAIQQYTLFVVLNAIYILITIFSMLACLCSHHDYANSQWSTYRFNK